MSKLYDDLFEKHSDPDQTLTDEAIPHPESLPANFLRRLGDGPGPESSKSEAHFEFDRRVVRVLFERVAEDRYEHPGLERAFSCGTTQKRLYTLLGPESSHLKKPFEGLVTMLLERYERPEVLFETLRQVTKATSAWALGAFLEAANPSVDEAGYLFCDPDEMNAPFDADRDFQEHAQDELSITASYIFAHTRGRDRKISLADRTAFYRTLFEEAPFTDEQRAWIINNRAFVNGSIVKGSGFFRAIGQLHDTKTFFAQSDDEAVRRPDATLSALRRIRDETTADDRASGFIDGDFEYALTGLDGEEQDVAKDLLRDRRHSDFKRWIDNGGTVRAWEVYHAARVSLTDAEPLRMALKHYEADTEALTKALRENLQTLGGQPLSTMGDPFAGLEYLIDNGARLDRVGDVASESQSAADVVLLAAQQADNDDSAVYRQLPEWLAQYGEEPTQAARALYEDPPEIARKGDASIYRPLVRRQILPTDPQAKQLHRRHNDLYEQLRAEMPRRARQALDARTHTKQT